MINWLISASSLAILAHLLIVLVIAYRVIMSRPATGVALAWLLLVVGAPFAGGAIYLMIGERRIGWRRFQGILTIKSDFKRIYEAAKLERLTEVDWEKHPASCRAVNLVGRNLSEIPTVTGSDFELFSDTQKTLTRIADDIDQAEYSVLMEFYIWQQGGAADEVLEAIIRAAERGVHCCLLVDDLGAGKWWKTGQPSQLRRAGVRLQAALPVGILRTLVGRTDLRLHRKIVVIDGKTAWTGSMNLVDPRFFKQDSGVGEWVDAMARLTGPVVVPLAATVLADWSLETGDSLDDQIAKAKLGFVEPTGKADIQVVPSGPGESGDALLQMILAVINAAQSEIVMTTPYLVPDDSLLRAIRGAAARGVRISLIVPEKVDSLMTRYASRSYFDDLLESNVSIYQYRNGLLHTKSILVDGHMSVFGTVNLDMRSIWLNYEVALFIYDSAFNRELNLLQQEYMQESDLLTLEAWRQRSFKSRLLENTLRLVSPLL